MKLSAAIREGSKKRPQCFGMLFETDWEDTLAGPPKLVSVKSCAWGAGLEGAGLINPFVDEVDPDYDEYLEEFDGLMDIHISDIYGTIHLIHCPADTGCDVKMDVPYLVEHLNDKHLWSREQIASWLEGMGL